MIQSVWQWKETLLGKPSEGSVDTHKGCTKNNNHTPTSIYRCATEIHQSKRNNAATPVQGKCSQRGHARIVCAVLARTRCCRGRGTVKQCQHQNFGECRGSADFCMSTPQILLVNPVTDHDSLQKPYIIWRVVCWGQFGRILAHSQFAHGIAAIATTCNLAHAQNGTTLHFQQRTKVTLTKLKY